MRPTTPTFKMNQGAGPSSPPETPTPTSSFQLPKHRGQTTDLPRQMPGINPDGQGPHFSYNPHQRAQDLSPQSRSTSPSSASSGSPPRSLSSEAADPLSESPPSPRIRRRIVAEGNFTVEEMRDSDMEELDSDDEDKIIRPSQYEDAESERGISQTRKDSEIDPRIVTGIGQMVFEDEDAERDARVQELREQKKQKRRTSSIVQKRKISESIGSSDEEDLQPVQLSANEAGSSARRLRRKVENLVFEDPPPGIPELEEPESCEDVVEADESDLQGVDRHLPFYVQVMDVDSDEY